MQNVQIDKPLPYLRLFAFVIGFLLNACSLTPSPLTRNEAQTQIASDKQALFARQEALTAPLTLYQAMSRALKYNLDHRIKMMERALAEGQASLARFDLLPEVVASAGYRSRSNYNASSSINLSTGKQSLPGSTSRDRSLFRGDLSLTWNILDFGVSYYRARQEGNKVLVTEEGRRKVSHNLMKDVRSAYWQALSAQRMTAHIQPVLAEARRAMQLAEQAELERLRPPLESLRYRKGLLEIVRRLEMLLEQQQMAKSELAGLINLPPLQDFSLAESSDDPWPDIPKLSLSMERMTELALCLRPELRQEMYQTRIGADEVKKAILRLLPGVEIEIGGHYDSNTFLVNQSWAEVGAQISKNLLELLSAPQAIETAEMQETLAHSRRLAAHMAILTQVHVARQQMDLANKLYQRSSELDDINQKIQQHVMNSELTQAMSALERIRVSVDSVLSELQRYQAYADSQDALGKLYVSLGFDPLPASMADDSVEGLAKALEAVDKEWQQGHYPDHAVDDPLTDTENESASLAGKSS